MKRIVSLLPSATEIVCALGLEEQLVGISHSCDYPPSVSSLPRLSRPRTNLDGLSSGEVDAAVRAALRDHGSVYEIDVERLAALEPDLILTQGICDVCAVPERQILDALEGARVRPSIVPTLKSGPSEPLRLKRSAVLGPLFRVGTEILRLDAHDLAAIFHSIRAVGCATGVAEQAERLVADMQRRIDAVRARVAGRPRPRVLALEWLDPPYVPGHWVPELIDAAGGDLVAGTAHQRSYRVEWDELRALEPDVVLVIPCGFDHSAARLAAQRHDALLQSFGAKVHCLDASAYFSRSGPRVVDGVELLSEIL